MNVRRRPLSVIANPGVLGWIAVGATVAIADGYAKAHRLPTMSDEFAHHFSWGVVLAAGTVAHLITHRREGSA